MKLRKFQEGGMMPAEGEAPMPEEQGAPMPAEGGQAGGQDQMMAQLQQVAADIINQMGPDAAAMLAQMIMEMLQGGAAQQGGQQFMRCGGKLVKKVGRGSKMRRK